ncbi:MAG: GNAT family N-acetyltransferase [Candidatus Sabulitectum sp.]|nr:GNAT family N-acetyltransferase [Candidatus Sabulitectum sp.]
MVRRAQISDADSIAGIIASAWQNAYTGIIDSDYPASISRDKYSGIFTDIIRDEAQTVFVFEKNKSVLGFTSGKIQDGKYDSEVIGLYILPEEQGNGIGGILLDEMMKHFKNENCNNMIIWTLLGAENNSFYRKHGGAGKEFKEIKIGKEKYPGIGFVFNLQ